VFDSRKLGVQMTRRATEQERAGMPSDSGRAMGTGEVTSGKTEAHSVQSLDPPCTRKGDRREAVNARNALTESRLRNARVGRARPACFATIYFNIINLLISITTYIKVLAERTAPASGPHPWETARPGYAAHLRGALIRETFSTHGKTDARTASDPACSNCTKNRPSATSVQGAVLSVLNTV